VTEQALETEAVLPPMFTALDRCDRCGAQAMVRAILTSGLLLFCNHHGNKYRHELHAANAIIERES
jgi:hypothetical protein